ncbi:MAG: glycosyltransferase family 2 protein [bacterium]|nr:glycosyltransferase family 2 protein [bacterium]
MISIVIPNWNGKEVLGKTLPTIFEALKYNGKEHEVIIVDDASTDGSPEFIKERFPSIRLIESSKNLGFGESVNIGIKEACFDIVILLSNDVMMKNDSLPPLLAHFENEQVFAVMPKVLTWDGKFFYGRRYGEIKRGHFFVKEDRRCNCTSLTLFASGGSAAFCREKFLELGGFDSLYHPFYWEEVDISYRAWKRGWKIIYEPKAIMYNREEGNIKQYKALEIKRISGRNSYLFTWKNITDKKLIISHLFFLPLLILRDLFKREPRFLICFWLALKRLKWVLMKRRKEKAYYIRSDKEVLDLVCNGYDLEEFD